MFGVITPIGVVVGGRYGRHGSIAAFLASAVHRLRFGMFWESVSLEARGTHCVLELFDCPSSLLNDEMSVRQALREAVEEGFATLLHEVSHKFHPQGVTALGLIAESHVAIHTWPEVGYAAVDVFTCGTRAKAEKACASLTQALQARRHTLTKLTRGLSESGVPLMQASAGPVPEPCQTD